MSKYTKSKISKSFKEPKRQFRKLEDVQREYQQYCLQAGDKQYTISVFENELIRLNGLMKELAKEASEIRQFEAKNSPPQTTSEPNQAVQQQ